MIIIIKDSTHHKAVLLLKIWRLYTLFVKYGSVDFQISGFREFPNIGDLQLQNSTLHCAVYNDINLRGNLEQIISNRITTTDRRRVEEKSGRILFTVAVP